MCYNCGCKMPNNVHGKAENIVNKTFRNAAKAMDMSYEDSLKNIRWLVDVELGEHAHGYLHDHGMDHDHDHDHSHSA